MIVDLIDWAATALRDPATGVNAIRHLVPRPPSDSAPPECLIYDQNQHGWTLRPELPPEILSLGLTLVVRMASEFEAPFLPEIAGKAPTIDLAILVAGTEDHAAGGAKHLTHTLRSAQRVLAQQFVAQTSPESTLTLATGIEITPTGSATWLPVIQPDGTRHLMAGLILPFTVHDAWVLGT